MGEERKPASSDPYQVRPPSGETNLRRTALPPAATLGLKRTVVRTRPSAMEAAREALPSRTATPWATTCYVSTRRPLTRLDTTVGEGTFGKVKLGKQELTGEKVRIKRESAEK